MQSVPEYLGLNISLAEAKRLLISLRKMKALGGIIPTKYRDAISFFNFNKAFVVAEKFFTIEKTKYPNLHFSEVKYLSTYSTLMYYTFSCISKEWIEAGLVPGLLFISIDKLDGHIWTDIEKKSLMFILN